MSIEVLSYTDNTDKPIRTLARSGVVGNFDVIRAMIKLIRASVTNDRRLEKFVKDLLLAQKHDSYANPEIILKLVFDYVISRVKYLNDIAGKVESITSPIRTLSNKFGDCDDLTILLCSMAGVLGFEDTRIALTKYSKNAKTFTHVYAVIYQNNKRFVLDASLPNPTFNKEIPYTEIKEVSVFDSIDGIDDIWGFLKTILDDAKSFGSKTAEAVPNISQFLPFGVLAGTALNAGAGVLLNSTSKELSFIEVGSKIGKRLDAIIFNLMHTRIALGEAKSQAVAVSSQLSLYKAENEFVYKSVTKRIKEKLDFINNFDTYARNNNIKITELNNKAMFVFGVSVISFSAWKLYKMYYRG